MRARCCCPCPCRWPPTSSRPRPACWTCACTRTGWSAAWSAFPRKAISSCSCPCRAARQARVRPSPRPGRSSPRHCPRRPRPRWCRPASQQQKAGRPTSACSCASRGCLNPAGPHAGLLSRIFRHLPPRGRTGQGLAAALGRHSLGGRTAAVRHARRHSGQAARGPGPAARRARRSAGAGPARGLARRGPGRGPLDGCRHGQRLARTGCGPGCQPGRCACCQRRQPVDGLARWPGGWTDPQPHALRLPGAGHQDPGLCTPWTGPPRPAPGRAGLYGGVVLSFLALGGLLLALRAAGEQLGWGFSCSRRPSWPCWQPCSRCWA